MLSGKKIILGVSASIAAYKAVYLLRLLVKAGAEVKVVITPSVKEFVAPLTFSSLSGKEVFSGVWEANWSEHVALGTWADLIIIAPATANTLAKMAQGICDNALLAVYLAARCPVMVAPAMDADMYLHPSLNRNIDTLQKDGIHVLPVGTGYLASGLTGQGRLLAPEEIVAAASALFAEPLLAGKKVLITAGPTQEAIDPVRYITNHSSGKMGYALAKAAADMGATVTLVSGPVSLPPPQEVNTIPVISAHEMAEATFTHAGVQDIVIMAAAVSDYSPRRVAREKIKKSGEEMVLELSKTTDILGTWGKKKPAGQFLVGFALETENEREHALGKLTRKNLDMIVMNSLKDAGAGFGHDTNKITIFDREGGETSFPLKSKEELAKDIMLEIVHKIHP
ncbi:MAG: bifunctional phosphopantothenoylcysteine decarboxylase/phosphopantothenate--cysteine ligase CoaBC [Bacteroidota bacterium]